MQDLSSLSFRSGPEEPEESVLASPERGLEVPEAPGAQRRVLEFWYFVASVALVQSFGTPNALHETPVRTATKAPSTHHLGTPFYKTPSHRIASQPLLSGVKMEKR